MGQDLKLGRKGLPQRVESGLKEGKNHVLNFRLQLGFLLLMAESEVDLEGSVNEGLQNFEVKEGLEGLRF